MLKMKIKNQLKSDAKSWYVNSQEGKLTPQWVKWAFCLFGYVMGAIGYGGLVSISHLLDNIFQLIVFSLVGWVVYRVVGVILKDRFGKSNKHSNNSKGTDDNNEH